MTNWTTVSISATPGVIGAVTGVVALVRQVRADRTRAPNVKVSVTVTTEGDGKAKRLGVEAVNHSKVAVQVWRWGYEDPTASPFDFVSTQPGPSELPKMLGFEERGGWNIEVPAALVERNSREGFTLVPFVRLGGDQKVYGGTLTFGIGSL